MKKKNRFFVFYITLSALCLIAGGLFFAIYHGYIVIRATSTDYQKPISHGQRRTINLYFSKHGKPRKEQVTVLWYGNNTQKTAKHIVNRWLRLIEEEQLPYRAVSLQSSIATLTHELYLSFDRTPFLAGSSTARKLEWMKDLLQTLRKAKTGINNVYILSNHAPLHDETLDFEIPWPITGFGKKQKNKKIVPHQRAHKKRRIRTIMLRPTDEHMKLLAKKIKKELETHKLIKVIITPSAHPAVSAIASREGRKRSIAIRSRRTNQLEAARAINLKGADYIVILHSYTTSIKKPQINLYAYSSYATASADRAIKLPSQSTLAFIPWDQAHQISLKQTKEWINTIESINAFMVPFKSLKGLIVPAIACECSTYKQIDLQQYANQITKYIKKAIMA